MFYQLYTSKKPIVSYLTNAVIWFNDLFMIFNIFQFKFKHINRHSEGFDQFFVGRFIY
jgi:hypothetical protein